MNGFIKNILGLGVLVILIAAMFFSISRLSGHTNPQDTNFSFFWLAGRMILNGENPYDERQYLAGHDENHINWRPNKIFPYPLPLAFFCIPLGFFSLKIAYLIWQIITLSIVAGTVFVLLHQWESAAQRRLFFPLFVAMFFFGPVYLSLRTGSIGAFPLLVLLLAALLLEKNKSFIAGMVLSLVMLKPPQGITILLLLGFWLFFRSDWKAIYGVVSGGITLLFIGLIQDPLWLMKFRDASSTVMERTQGVHSNVWAFAYLACNGKTLCSTLFGAISSLFLISLSGFFLWRKQNQLTAWEIISFIIPIGFVSTVYLWEYDQILYVFPIVWVVGMLVQKTRTYIYAFLFLMILIFYAIFAVGRLSATSRDLWSLGNSLIVMAGIGVAYFFKERPELEKINHDEMIE